MAKKKTSLEKIPLVAIDFGSDTVKAMAGEYTQDGLLRVLGVETSYVKHCVERGVINNSSNAAYTINEVLRLLANRIHVETLPYTFVCIGGRSLTIADVSSKRDQVRKREVPKSLLEEMEEECKQKIEAHNQGVAVLDLIPSYFSLDGQYQETMPTPNQRATIVEAHYTAFVGREEIARRLTESFDRSTKNLEKSFVRPDTLFNVLVSDDDMARGCAILDMGAQTTTLTICKEWQYLLNKVVPKGGYDISRDIEAQGMSLPYAEKIKCEYGVASPDMVATNYRMRIPTSDGEVVIDMKELATIIAGSLDRILDPLMQILNEESERVGVLYITGGASMLNGVDQYIQSKTQIPVMYGSHAMYLTSDTPDEMCAPNYSALIGTLLLGADHRQKHPHVTPQKKGLLDKLKESTLDIFSGQDAGY